MPSEIAQTIVNQIFGDEKAKAVDSVNDALSLRRERRQEELLH